MAGDITLLPLLIGLGATSMSVGVHLVPIIRYAIRNLDYGQCPGHGAEGASGAQQQDHRGPEHGSGTEILSGPV